MIPQSAIKAFLKAPRDDHRWLKEFSDADLDAALKSIKPLPQLNQGLRKSQKVGFLLGVAYPQFCFWYDMGTGKTVLSLELLRYWWECGKIRRALVFVTSDKAFPTWEKQRSHWNIDIPYIALSQPSSKEKWEALETFKEGLIFITYPAAVNMTTYWVKGKRGKKGGKPKNHMKLDPKLVAQLGKNVDALILDESTRAGHFHSLTTKLCAKLRENVQFCYALAGRPFGREPMMLWSQHHIVDGGETLGETLGLFRAAFYSEQDNPWDPKGFAKDYTFKKKMMPQLMRIVQHRSIAYSAEECGIKSKFIPIIEEVRLPEEASAYYRKVVDNIIAAKGNLQEMKNAFMRMRQLSSGFLGFRNDESGDRVEIGFAENPKLDRLLELIEEMPDDSKAVCFYDFTHTGRCIYHDLKEVGHDPIWLWSGNKNYAADLKMFMGDEACRVAIINNKIGAYSLDGLQVANYCFFVESPVGVLDREQAERRLRRQGQQKVVLQYDLCVRGTLDGKILQFHREGDDILAALRANPKSLLEALK
jgi:hypothetical protein